MVLSMYGAREVDAASAPQFYGMVRELAQRAGLPMPKVYLIDEAQPNAFATGRNPEHAAVAATTGILQLLTARELRGVMAHELAHVKHRDILIRRLRRRWPARSRRLPTSRLLFGGRERGPAANPIVALMVMILAPHRGNADPICDFAAPASSRPTAAARRFPAIRRRWRRALEKIERYAQGLPMATAEQHPETAQMMIINPLSGGGIAGLFSTHPTTSERIARLLALAR